jgi:hypothetical protein
MMAQALQQRQQQQPGFTGRLPPAVGNADPRMVAQPGADPGYAMPNVAPGNLNQAPGQAVGGTLPAGLSGVLAPGAGAQAPQAPDLRYQQWLQAQMQNYVRQQMMQGQGAPQGQPMGPGPQAV